MKKKNIGIIWANPYNKNMGVAALAYSALALVYDVLRDKGIEAKISFIGSSKLEDDVLVINGQRYEFGNIIAQDYLKIKTLAKLILKAKKLKTKEILSQDYILDVGEGDSFSDIYGDRRCKKITNSKIFFTKLGKKQMLMPQTAGPFSKKVNRDRAKKALSRFEIVTCRDNKSLNYLQNDLGLKNAIEIIDLAFYMPYEKQIINNKKINVGINVSGLLWNGGYTNDNQFNLATDYKELIRKTINFFMEKENIQIHLIPHVVPLDFGVEDDYKVSNEINVEFGGELVVSPRFTTPIEAKSYISGMDFFTGARMHSTIAAFATGVPVYPMAYSRKFNGLFADTLKYEYMGDCVNDSTSKVYNGLVNAYDNKLSLEKQINESLKEIVEPRIELLKNKVLQLVND